jgi:signal transduction histidine kinase
VKKEITPSLYKLFDNLIEGVMILDGEGQIVYHNPRACQILRCNDQPVRGKKIDEVFEQLALIDETKQQLTITILGYLKEGAEIKDATMTYKTIYGTSGNLALSFFIFDDQPLWVVSFLDITEALRDKLHRTRFVRAIGHELKHPLSSLKAYIYMIRKRLVNAEPNTQRYLQQADEQIDVLTAMLNDLTDVSKISLQEFEVEAESQIIEPLLKKIVEDFQVANPQQKIVFHDLNGKTMVKLDSIRFRQVLNNILSNAVRYSDVDKSVVVSLKDQGDRLAVAVKDQGEGIDANDLERIFDPYFRTKKGYQHKGLGLGLYIVKEAMRRQGGSIEVASKKGKGTTITLFFQKA